MARNRKKRNGKRSKMKKKKQRKKRENERNQRKEEETLRALAGLRRNIRLEEKFGMEWGKKEPEKIEFIKW